MIPQAHADLESVKAASATSFTGVELYATGIFDLVERNWQAVAALLLMAIDALAVWLPLTVVAPALQAQSGGAPAVAIDPYWSLVVVLCNVLVGVYRQPYTATRSSQLRRTIKACAVACIVILIDGRRRHWSIDASAAAYLAIVVPGTLLLTRSCWAAVRADLQAKGWALDRTVVIRSREEGAETPEWLRGLRAVGYDVKAVVRVDGSPGALLAEVDRQVRITGARCILIPNAELVANGYGGLLQYGCATGVTIKLESVEVQGVLARAGVHDVSGVTITSPVRYKVSRVKRLLKRVVDVLAGLVLLVLAAPMFLLAAAAVKLESRGPLFFRQRRSLTRTAPAFLCCKFRSMYCTTDRLRDELRRTNGVGGALFKIRADPRVTRVGRLIRRLSIDELPQLLNVIRGDMSLVGPRPLPVEDHGHLTEIEAMGGLCELRAAAKPGITGLWQICGRSKLGYREMVLLDLYYIHNHTILLDLEILLHTVPAVLIGRGAY
jgi:exopolysaccharide biosynthesis polyprenyl glycosylphosphotransferase